MAWAVAQLVVEHAPLRESISEAALTRICHFGAQSLSNTVWAMARLSVPHMPLRASISSSQKV